MHLGATIAATPTWVWAVLAFLIWRGIKASKAETIKVRRLFLLPVVVLIFGSSGLLAAAHATASLISWGVALAAGLGLGFSLAAKVKVRADHDQQLIEKPGDWSFLPLVLTIFAVKYYFGYEHAVAPDLARSVSFKAAEFGVAAGIAGLLLGKSCALWRAYTIAPSEPLFSDAAL